MAPIVTANIAISVNHILFALVGPLVVWFLPWGWPTWVFFGIVLGPMFIIDGIVWPLVYGAAKRDIATKRAENPT